MQPLEDLIKVILHALPVACVAWTLTHEEIFRDLWESCGEFAKEHKEKLDYLRRNRKTAVYSRRKALKHWLGHKVCFLFTCEFCVSVWVTILLLLVSDFRVQYNGLLGFLVTGFGVVMAANLMMTRYQLWRVEIRKDRAVADKTQKK